MRDSKIDVDGRNGMVFVPIWSNGLDWLDLFKRQWLMADENVHMCFGLPRKVC